MALPSGQHAMAVIAKYLGIHPTPVNRMMRRCEDSDKKPCDFDVRPWYV